MDTFKDCAIGTISEDFKTNILISQLQTMMDHTNEHDRCILCKTIDKLQKDTKPVTNGNSWVLLLIMIFILFGYSSEFDDTTFDQTFMDAFLETLKKKTEGENNDEPS